MNLLLISFFTKYLIYMNYPWTFSPLKPLTRLQVTDGLEITAQRWNLAHNYHRQRQNIYFQSLHQPGIVYGLGVCLIDVPEDIAPQYRDRRWLQIQPGLAIDCQGNLIVVPQPLEFRLVSQVRNNIPLTIYLVISYVDPQELQNVNNPEVIETFRVDEKNQPPTPEEIELCRILLQPGETVLQIPRNVFFPSPNCLDLRYRPQSRIAPQSLVKIAMVDLDYQQELEKAERLQQLLNSVEGLYPTLTGEQEIGVISLDLDLDKNPIFNYDLLYLGQPRSQQLSQGQVELLKTYLERGGTILIEISIENTKIEALRSGESQLIQGIERLDYLAENIEVQAEGTESSQSGTFMELIKLKPSLQAELQATQAKLKQEIENMTSGYYRFAQQLDTPLGSWEDIGRDHPLRNQPFLFAALPKINNQSLQLFVGGGLIIIIGDLSAAWGLDKNLKLNRGDIRTAQEFGVNMLQFACQRRKMSQALYPPLKFNLSQKE
jgi:hypothetical protein